MNRKEQWIDEVMNSLDGMQQAKAPAGFHHKVMNAIVRSKQVRLSPLFSWSVAAGLFLLIGLNAVTIVHLKSKVNKENTRDFANDYYSSVSN